MNKEKINKTMVKTIAKGERGNYEKNIDWIIGSWFSFHLRMRQRFDERGG
jgi:hypothetical protein